MAPTAPGGVGWRLGDARKQHGRQAVKDDWSHQEGVDGFPGLAAACLNFDIGVYFLSGSARGRNRLAMLHALVSNLVKRRSPGEPLRWPGFRAAGGPDRGSGPAVLIVLKALDPIPDFCDNFRSGFSILAAR
jgi:hypothetical protein